jgi:hypothetical protein
MHRLRVITPHTAESRVNRGCGAGCSCRGSRRLAKLAKQQDILDVEQKKKGDEKLKA